MKNKPFFNYLYNVIIEKGQSDMEKIGTLLKALWEQDFQTLANPDLVVMLYAVLFVVLVLENGRCVEYGSTRQVLSQPRADYTKALLAAVPKLRR